MKFRYGWHNFIIELETESVRFVELIEKYTNFHSLEGGLAADIRLEAYDLDQGPLAMEPPADAEFMGIRKVQLESVVDYFSYRRGEEDWRIYQNYGSYYLDRKHNRMVVERLLAPIEFEYYSILLLVLMPMMELLKKFGYHRFHTACVNVKGHAILLSGESGSGKSTSTFALMESGYPVLSDEMPLIRFMNGQYEATVLSDTVKICEDSRQRFFQAFTDGMLCECWKDEWYYQLRNIQTWECEKMESIQHLFVLKQSGKKKTRIVPLHPAQAVSSLFPVTIKPGGEEEMEKVFRFVMTFLDCINCYQVEFGTDMDDFVESLEGVLNN